VVYGCLLWILYFLCWATAAHQEEHFGGIVLGRWRGNRMLRVNNIVGTKNRGCMEGESGLCATVYWLLVLVDAKWGVAIVATVHVTHTKVRDQGACGMSQRHVP
jgi:hypothetical protein